jgi:hypothetical protein
VVGHSTDFGFWWQRPDRFQVTVLTYKVPAKTRRGLEVLQHAREKRAGSASVCFARTIQKSRCAVCAITPDVHHH